MRFKCPHCQVAREYSEAECREIYIRCKNCSRDFRASESSPLTSTLDDLLSPRAGANLARKPEADEGRVKNVAKLNAEAAIYIKRGDYERARAGLQESLRMKPNQPHVERLLRKIASLR